MRIVNRLTEKEVKNAKPEKGKFVKRLLDGNGLYLQATLSKTGGINRNWVFRYELDGERHDMGLGSLNAVGLAAARQKAKKLREQIVLEDIDPLEAREQTRAERRTKAQAARAERAKSKTFAQCVEDYLAVHGDKWKNAKHATQWRATLETYAYPIIGDLNVADVDESHLVKVLQPIWKKVPETARRVRGRIEAVLGWAIVSRIRKGENPARWKNHLQTLLGGVKKENGHHAALPVDEAPSFMAELRARRLTSASALEFLIVTAARTGEVIGARWSEIDLKRKMWTVPAGRMKAGIEHRVPLSARAVEILNGLERHGDFVFGTAVTGKPLSDMAMLELIRRMNEQRAARGLPLFVDPKQNNAPITVHGFRSTIKDWAGDRTAFARDVVEAALAHSIENKTEAAYRRGDALEKRRKLMEAWAGFLAKPLPAEGGNNVLIIKRG